MKQTFNVQVDYTEPEFQRRSAKAPAEYSYTYRGIEAFSVDEAIRIALKDFQETARCSRVGWRRCVERVTVSEVEFPAFGGSVS